MVFKSDLFTTDDRSIPPKGNSGNNVRLNSGGDGEGSLDIAQGKEEGV